MKSITEKEKVERGQGDGVSGCGGDGGRAAV